MYIKFTLFKNIEENKHREGKLCYFNPLTLNKYISFSTNKKQFYTRTRIRL